MKLYNILPDKFPSLIMAPALLLLMASCGSYQYAGYGNDGIYGDNGTEANDQYENGYYGTQPAQPQQQQQSQQDQNNSQYYKDLFGEKSAQYESVPSEGAIFTDIEAYTSNQGNADEIYYEEEGNYNDEGYGPWGSESTSVSINYYGNFAQPMFYYPMWNRGWYGGYAYNPYWGGGFYNGWGMGFGFGYSPMYYGGFYSPFHYGYASPMFYGNAYSPYFRRSNVAYNAGRRNTYYNNYNNGRTNNVYSRGNNSRNTLSTPRTTRSNNYNLLRGENRSQTRPRVDVDRSQQNQRPTINNSRSSNNQNRSNRSNTRSQSSPQRSSGTINRGSSGGGRSSGTRSSGGGGRRGGR